MSQEEEEGTIEGHQETEGLMDDTQKQSFNSKKLNTPKKSFLETLSSNSLPVWCFGYFLINRSGGI